MRETCCHYRITGKNKLSVWGTHSIYIDPLIGPGLSRPASSVVVSTMTILRVWGESSKTSSMPLYSHVEIMGITE